MGNYKEAFERIKKFTKLIADVPVASLRQRSEVIKDLEAIENALEEYSKLKDKIKNKTLIELPCKVGDKVYVIYDTFYSHNEITVIDGRVQHVWKMFGETKIKYIDVHSDKLAVKFDYTFEDKICIGASGQYINYSSKGIVEMLHTKEEAEAKLKELKEKEKMSNL